MKDTSIEWATHTFNPWFGCSKVSAGCQNCYAAEMMDTRFGKVRWGKGQRRKRTSVANWREPLLWNRSKACTNCGRLNRVDAMVCEDCAHFEFRRPRVFCASLADWLDDEVPVAWLADLLNLIHLTPNLDWLLLTKRPENWRKRIEKTIKYLFDERKNETARFANIWLGGKLPPNVWIGTSVEDQSAADERIPHLLKIPARVRFLSCEPLLGKLVLPLRCEECGYTDWDARFQMDHHLCKGSIPEIDWVICGGESGKHARPMNPDWARSLRDQCAAAGIPFFFKQFGEWVQLSQSETCEQKRAAGYNPGFHVFDCESCESQRRSGVVYLDRAECQCVCVYSFGKKHTGRLLDGVEHNGFPKGGVQ